MVTLPVAASAYAAHSIRLAARINASIFFIECSFLKALSVPSGQLSQRESQELTYTNDDRPYPSCLPLWGRWLTQSAGEGYSTYTITVMPMRTVSSGVKSTYATYCALC